MKEELTISSHIADQIQDALRLASNILGSRKRETAADRQIEYAERLIKWVIGGKIGPQPMWLPRENERV